MVSVGSASVSIVPDARGFSEKLRAEIGDVTVKIEARVANLVQTQGVFNRLTQDRTAKINATLDDAGVRAKLDAATKPRSVTINADADTGAAESRLAALGASADGAGGRISALIAAGAAIAPAIVPAAGAATGALIAMGSGAIVGAGGIGVLVLGLSGIVSSVTAVMKAQQTAGAEAAKNAAAQVAAAQRIQSAQVGVQSAEAALANARANAADAARRSLQAVQQAQQGVRDATQQAAQGVAQAIGQEAIAERSLQQALQQETDAQHALSDARRQAKRDLQDLNMSVQDGALAQRQAALDVVSARNALLALNSQTGTPPTAVQQQQAQLNYDEAVQRQKELAVQQQRLVQQQHQANRAGVSGAPGVIAARSNLAQARQGVTDAQQGVADAQAAITAARIAGVEQINKAEQSLANAEAARTAQQRQSAYSVAQAQQQVINSQKTLQDAYAKTGTAAASSGDAAKEALAKLSPEGRKLVDFITDKLIPGFHDFSKIAQAPIAGGVLAGLKDMKPLLPVVKGLVVDLANQMGALLESAGEALGSPFWVNFFRMISTIAGPTIDAWGKIIGDVLAGFAGMIEKFAPIGQQMLDWTEKAAKKFRDFGTGKTNGLGRFFDYVQQVGPLVVGTIGSLFRAAGHVVVALAPLGTTALAWIKKFADWISRIPADTLRKVGEYALIIVGATKGIGLASGAFRLLGTAIEFLSGPVGWITLGVAAVVGGFILLYRHSKTFHDFVDQRLVPVLKDAAKWVQDHLGKALSDLWGYIQDKVVPILEKLAKQALSGARDALKEVTQVLQRNRPELEQVKKALGGLWTGFKQMVDFVVRYVLPLLGPVLKAAFQACGDEISGAIWTISTMVDIFDTLVGAGKKLFNNLEPIFKTGVAQIKKIWHGLEDAAKAPVSFIINTVLDKGLIPAYNWVAGILPGVDKIKPVHIRGFAAGTSNVLPGYTPGRDVHRFYSPTAGVMDLSGGEGIGRPELVAAIGKNRWDAANAAAARGDVAQGVRYLGGFAAAGILPSLGGGGTAGARIWPTNTRRLSPTYAGHSGVDIAAGYGAPIYAATNGTISYTGWGHGYGQAIFEKILGSALSIVYGHTSKLIARAGQHVSAGQLIGLVGATGHATGPHLHFEINSPGPFGNAADRAASLAWLNGRTVHGGGGTVHGGGTSGWLSQLQQRISGPLGKLRSLGSGAWAHLISGVPTALATGMLHSAKNILGDAFVTGSNKARGMALLTAAGFNPLTQWGPLNKLWNRESGWRTTATNPTSGAYGIPQALPAAKMASAGPDWRTNPNTQIRWGLQYIKDTYGTPAAAWAHELAAGWYDHGGWLQPGTTLVTNDTGKPEPVLSPSQWDAISNGGSMAGRPIHITLHQDGMNSYVQGVIDDNNAFHATVARMRRP